MSENGKAEELEAIYQRNALELFALANETRAFASAEDKLTFMREQWGRIEDLVHQQKRALDYQAGEHKPETLHTAVQLEGRFGDIFPGMSE